MHRLSVADILEKATLFRFFECSPLVAAQTDDIRPNAAASLQYRLPVYAAEIRRFRQSVGLSKTET
jgi:hypothetical protein